MIKEFYPEGCMPVGDKQRRFFGGPADVAALVGNKKIAEAVATMCDADHNLMVDLGCMKGIIPRDEGAIGISEGELRDIALISRVGKAVCFTVERIATDSFGKMYAVLSRRSAQLRCRQEYISKLSAGDIIDARITHLEPFGAFCDIGCGIIALLPIDSISVSRISHPKDRFFVGQDIRVAVRRIMPDGKIMLTLKELLGTWEENAQLLCAGQTVTGIVRSVENYGIFVELSPNLAGLAESKSGVYVGDSVSVYIKSIIRDKMKVKLIIIDSFSGNHKQPLKYFYEGDRIECWCYSPIDAPKQIITEF